MKLTLTLLRETLRESVFDPRKPGPLSIITEIDNRGYFEMRAFELVREAQEALILQANPAMYQDKITMAISLLAVAKIKAKEEQGKL